MRRGFILIQQMISMVHYWATIGLLALIIHGSAHAWQTPKWQDGIPQFTRIDSSQSVIFDSTITLQSVITTNVNSQTMTQILLGGLGRIDTVILDGVQNPLDFNKVPIPNTDIFLVTDAFSRKVYTINSSTKKIVSTFGSENVQDPDYLLAPVKARAYDGSNQGTFNGMLVTDAGNDKVLMFNYLDGTLVWTYDTNLNEPSAAITVIDSSQVIICDKGNSRIVFLAMLANSAVFLKSGGESVLSEPVDIEYQAGQLLVTDKVRHAVYVMDANDFSIIQQFGVDNELGADATHLSSPIDAQFLPNGNVLIADAGNKRIIEVDMARNLIVWEFLPRVNKILSATRLANDEMLSISDRDVLVLGYKTKQYILGKERGLGRAVDFDSLSFSANIEDGTSIRYQMRTAIVLADLEGADWIGPTGEDSWYETEFELNSVHDGDRFYQIRAELTTNSPLRTAVLNSLTLHYHYFNTERDGRVLSAIIADTSASTITNWQKISGRTILPINPTDRKEISLVINVINANTGARVHSFSVSDQESTFEEILTDVSALATVNRIRLEGIFNTNNTSVAPILDDWAVDWVSVQSSPSSIKFVDIQNINDVDVVRLKTDSNNGEPNSIFVSLTDLNLAQRSIPRIKVALNALQSGDSDSLELSRQGASAEYFSISGMSGFIRQTAGTNNGVLEMHDRDTLIVRYVDPIDPSDISQDSILIVERTRAILTVETQTGPVEANQDIRTIDSLYLHITNERDHDLSPARDSIFAQIIDTRTNDLETIKLLEIPNSGSSTIFSTGEFYSPKGINITTGQAARIENGRLETLAGNQFVAQYLDLDTAIVFLNMVGTPIGEPAVEGEGAINLLLAPNPYKVSSGETMRLRIEAYTGSLTLEKIEIYNLAGESVKTINASEFNLDRGPSISIKTRSTTQGQWWDFTNKYGEQVGSGTYFARLIGEFTDELGQKEDVTFLRKFVIVR
ncbi:MAG: hypothetical protein DWQ05_01660 [Calditrichaeota bacterium]|nr:MAG: hypothetical protein DWQ05_01660 [Calditrichota bacterium]